MQISPIMYPAMNYPLPNAGFYNPFRDSVIKIKHETDGDTFEDDIRRIKEAAKEGFYSPLSFLPYKMMNFNGFKSERFTPPPPSTPDLHKPPSNDMKLLANTYVDPENPHCKRKSLPLEKCPICKKFFRRMTTHLQKHAESQMHHPESALSCRYCSKMFSNLGNLSIHLRTHTGMKPYVCEVCSKSFAQSCNLTNHMRTHTGERPFKCPHCDRAFSQSGNLSNHIRLHLDQKPFKCHFCDRAFTQSGNLNSHIKNNHKNELSY